MDFIDQFLNQHLPNIVVGLIILLAGLWVAGAIKRQFVRVLTRRKFEEILVRFFATIIHMMLVLLVVVISMTKVGIPMTSVIAVLGAAGLAVGLALQGSLSNFASGVLIITFRPFKTGDYIEGGGTAGTVEEVHIFSTKLKTPDNCSVVVPNSLLTGDAIKNYTGRETRRLDLVVGVSYGDDLQKTKEILNEIVRADPRVLEDPEPTIGVLELGDSSVNFAVRPWVKTADYWPTRFDLLQAIKVRLDEAGITIPFPQRDVHVYEEKKSA